MTELQTVTGEWHRPECVIEQLQEIIKLILSGTSTYISIGQEGVAARELPLLLPREDTHIWNIAPEAHEISNRPSIVGDVLEEPSQSSTLVVEALTRHRKLRASAEYGDMYESGVILYNLLSVATQSTEMGLFLPYGLIHTRKHSALRRYLDQKHQVKWLIFFSANEISAALRFVFLVVRTDATSDSTNVTRLVSLEDIATERWVDEVAQAEKRGGGEVGASIVLRDENLGSSAWTYERFSEALVSVRKDATTIGELKPLRSLVEPPVAGLFIAQRSEQIIEVGESEDPPDEAIPALTGRDVLRALAQNKPEQFTAELTYTFWANAL